MAYSYGKLRGAGLGNEGEPGREEPKQEEKSAEVSSVREMDPHLAELDWHNETNYLDKTQDIELLAATAFDYKFLNIHHKVRTILDTIDELGGGISFDELYTDLSLGYAEQNRESHITLLNKKDGKPVGGLIDILGQARLRKLKEKNEFLGIEKFTDAEIEQGLKTGNLKKEVKNPNTGTTMTVDLLELVPEIEISKEDFAYYLDTIQENQAQLQLMSDYRDPSINGHHAEKSGHAQQVTIAGKSMFVPVGILSAAAYARGDVKKQGMAFLAKGHVHEIGWYEENYGTLVKIEAEAYRIWRGSINNGRIHEHTDLRMKSNLLGLASGELPQVNKTKNEFYFGSGGKGKIYKSMRKHYDTEMTDTRGYGITDAEIGDKLITDIVGVAYAQNAYDWLMTFATVSGIADSQSIITPDAMSGNDKGEGRNWSDRPVFVFNAKRPKGKEEFKKGDVFPDNADEKQLEIGPLRLVGIPALTSYIQWRVARGEIAGVTGMNGASGKTLEEQEREAGELENGGGEEKEVRMNAEQVDKMAEVIKGIFANTGYDVLSVMKLVEDGDIHKIQHEVRQDNRVVAKEEMMQFDKPIKSDSDTDAIIIDSEEKLLEFLKKRLERIRIEAHTALLISGGSTQSEDVAQAILSFFKKSSVVKGKENQMSRENFKQVLDKIKQ